MVLKVVNKNNPN